MRSRATGAGLGYGYAVGAAALFAVNGTVSKTALQAGLEPARLTALRCVGAAAGLLVALAVTAPQRLRLRWREIPFLLVYGVAAVAMTQWLYFVAIGRLPVGVALLVEFTAPLLVALWARLVFAEPIRPRVWAALALSTAGLALVAEVWRGGGQLDGLGLVAAGCAAVALAAYFLMGERGLRTHQPLALTCWSLVAAALFWSVVQPWWSFDRAVLGHAVAVGGPLGDLQVPLWAFVLWIVVLGTIAPFSLSLMALRRLPATVVGVAAMAEPVVASAVAWVWLHESLSPVQLGGGAVVIVGIVLAQTARTGHAVEPATSTEMVA